MGEPGSTNLSHMAYALVIRMFADNWWPRRVLQEVHARFAEHRPDGERPVLIETIKGLKKSRQEEIRALRGYLNSQLDDLWIANKRARLEAAQNIFMDANRWVPKRVLEIIEKSEGSDGTLVTRSMVVYEKETRVMLDALRYSREELGVDPGSRVAQSLEDLVREAERSRGLQVTEGAPALESGTVPILEDARLIESPTPYHTKGALPSKNILGGAELPELTIDVPGD